MPQPKPTKFEKVYVETPVDTDGDGKRDLIAVYIKRPLVSHPVPAVYVANPYMLHCNEDWYTLYDVNTNIKAYPTQDIDEKDIQYIYVPKTLEHRPIHGQADENTMPEPSPNQYECISDLYDHLIDRGYAAIFCGGLGTKGSDGITLTGSHEEILAFKSVIDWLNGNALAFTNREDGIQIKAHWCSGNVAMSARSYLGTMAIGVATTGVPGLKTIIPEAGISNWYEYYRHNGLTLPAMDWQGDDLDILALYCFSRALDPQDYPTIQSRFEKSQKQLQEQEDRESANYNRFWDERNYLKHVDNIQASIFVIQGLNDWNVKPDQGIRLFEAMQAQGKECMMLLHRGQHIYTYHLEGAPTLDLIDRWLDHYLKGIDNGIEKGPRIYVENNLDQKQWDTYTVWPPVKDRFFEFHHPEATFMDDLSLSVYDRKEKNTKAWLDQLVTEKNAFSYRLPVQSIQTTSLFSGRAKIRFRAKINQPTAILSAMLVDHGKQCRLTPELDGDENQHFVFKQEKNPSDYFVITRAWMNAQNRSCNYKKEAIDPDTFYTYEMEFVSNDYRIEAHHTLVLILYGMDVDQTQLPYTKTQITIEKDSIELFLPIKATD